MRKNLLITIPAFNEEQVIGKVIKTLPRKLKGIKKITVLVVDDGSSDKTAQIARKCSANVISHMLNRGLGGALGTGFEYAKKKSYDLMVTLDADGQHNPEDIPRLIQPIIQNRADVVTGSRLLSRLSTMPYKRIIINFLSNILTFFLFGIWTTDSQSGFRAFSRKAVRRISIHTQGMEVSSEIFREIKRKKLKKVEVPISAIYTSYSLKKGQQLSNAPNVFLKLVLQRFKASIRF